MNTVQRQVFLCAGLAFVSTMLFAIAFFWAFPLSDWTALWDKHFMDIPFIIFVPASSIVIGIIIGMASGLYWKKQFQFVEKLLHQLEEGRHIELEDVPLSGDMQSIAKRFETIDRQISEQAKLSQRLATEKVQEQEKIIQESISQERNRLARELHDSVSQQLFAASMMISAINETKKQSDDTETKQLKMVEGMIHQSQLEMRALLLHLRPVALKNKSLQEGIEELLVELSQKVTMDINWKVEDFALDKGVEDHLFRILQETVSNTLRHAKATRLDVLLIKRENLIIMRIVDDGIGFQADETKAGSYGIQNIHERALEVGGTLKIVSVKGKGTRLEVKVPLVTNGDDTND